MHVMGTGYILHVIYLQLHAVETRGHKDDLVTMHYSRLSGRGGGCLNGLFISAVKATTEAAGAEVTMVMAS